MSLTPCPKETADLSCGWWAPLRDDMDVLAEPQIDPAVLDFSISLQLRNCRAQSADSGSANLQKLFLQRKFLGGTYEQLNTP